MVGSLQWTFVDKTIFVIKTGEDYSTVLLKNILTGGKH